jgi:hypothetical protein
MNALQRRLSIAVNLDGVSFKLEQVLQCFLHGRIVSTSRTLTGAGVKFVGSGGLVTLGVGVGAM